jgi:hypothetical protein
MTIKFTESTDEQRLFELYKQALNKEDNPQFAIRWATRRLYYFQKEVGNEIYRKEIEDEA